MEVIMYESLFEQINRPDSRCIAPSPRARITKLWLKTLYFIVKMCHY